MRVTRNNIAKAIKSETGLDVEIVPGNGYFYFRSVGDFNLIDYAECQSIYVNQLSDYTVDRWVSEFKGLIEGAEKPSRDGYNYVDGVIVLGAKSVF